MPLSKRAPFLIQLLKSATLEAVFSEMILFPSGRKSNRPAQKYSP